MDAGISQNSDDSLLSPETLQELENLRLQVENLERFKNLFFEMEAKLAASPAATASPPTLSVSSEIPTTNKEANQNAVDQFNQMQSLSSDQESMMKELRSALQSLELEDSKNKGIIETQIESLQKFERQLEEAKGCSAMLEDELERLVQENESLASQLEAMASMPSPAANAPDSEEVANLKSSLNEAENAAYNAMISCGDLGVIIKFFHDNRSCESIEVLANLVFSSLQAYGVTSTLQLRNAFQTINLSDTGDLDPTTIQLFETHKAGERIVDEGEKIVVTFENASLCVEQLPSDEVRASAIKDNVVTLMSGVDAKVRSLELEQKNDQQRNGMMKLIHSTKDALGKVDDSFKAIEKDTMVVMNDLIQSVNSAGAQLNLPVEATQYLSQLTMMGQSNMENIYKNAVRIDKQFAEIIGKLEKTINR